MVDELGVIRRLAEGVLARAAKRVAESAGYRKGADRDAAQAYARAAGVETSEARRAIGMAKQLEHLPATEATVREGRLSTREAVMIAEAATADPNAEADLLDAAAEGMVPLKDACLAARARAEDPVERVPLAGTGADLPDVDFGRRHGRGSFQAHARGRRAGEIGGRQRGAAHLPRLAANTVRTSRTRPTPPTRSPISSSPNHRNARSAAIAAHVVIDHAALVRGNTLPGERCEIPGVGPVSVEWVRSILGEAFVTVLMKKGRDITTVAHFGRHIPAHLRTTMIVGGRECDIEGCHNRGYLELDHSEVDFAAGGPAAWWNLDWLCSVDHDRKTRGWKLGPRDPVTGKRRLDPPASAHDGP